MDKKRWKNIIKNATEEAGMYRPFFNPVIDTLAAILERRDQAEEEFEASGSQIVVEHTNQGGNTNTVKNPLLVMINELNRDALAYWRDLGLTPAGLKKINEDGMKKIKKSPLAEAIKALG